MFFFRSRTKLFRSRIWRELIFYEKHKNFENFLECFGIFWNFLKKSGTKNMKLPKTPKNGGLPQDYFRHAKRAGKTLVLGFQEKNTAGENTGA